MGLSAFNRKRREIAAEIEKKKIEIKEELEKEKSENITNEELGNTKEVAEIAEKEVKESTKKVKSRKGENR